MTNQPPADPSPVASADALLVAESIRGGWIGRGFKLGIGFFLAGLVVMLLPMILLTSCIATVATVAGGAAMGQWTQHWEHWDDDDKDEGQPVAVTPPAPQDQADAAAAANTAASDTAPVAAAPTQ